MKLADIEQAQEMAEGLAAAAAAAEAARAQHQAALNSQEEDLAVREDRLAATLHGKDEEAEKLVVQRTQELEWRHREALNALAQAHTGKVKELEDQTLKDTLNGA